MCHNEKGQNDVQHLSYCVYFTQRGACLPVYMSVHVCVCVVELDPYAVEDRAVWDVCMHNSVCHSYLNEERRKWDPQWTVGVKKKCESLFMVA